MVENKLHNKKLYKIFISFIKYVPNVLALLRILGIFIKLFWNNFILFNLHGRFIFNIFNITVFNILYI